MVDFRTYLADVTAEMAKKWPENRTVNIVCHGHSVPAGYFATPYVNTFSAYPHQLHQLLKERFPFAVLNVIVTGIGGENSESGAARFERDVLCHRPDVLTIDYALNDRGLGLERAETAWRSMIEKALAQNVRVILLTPTWDNSYYVKNENWEKLGQHAQLVRRLAEEYGVGLADSFACFEAYCRKESDLAGLLSHVNHPTQLGHELVAREIAKYFIAR